MCLSVDPAATARLAAKLAAAGSLIAYKVLLRKGGQLSSPCVGAGRRLLYGPGRTQALGRRPRSGRFIRGGAIHVFLTRAAARSYARDLCGPDLVVVRVRVEGQDFLGASESQRAAFRALALSNASHAHALRGERPSVQA